MYSDTITLFNRYHSRSGDIWYPHVLHNVNLIVDKASIIAKYGTETTDRANLHVKYTKSDNDILIEGIKYLPSKEWYQLLNEELADYITFNSQGNLFDFFIIGEYPEVPINDEYYMDGFFEEMEKRTECYTISSVSSPYKVIQHFEITAR